MQKSTLIVYHYVGECSCGQAYIGETKRNTEIRFSEHTDPRKCSEPAKHLKSNIDHSFVWKKHLCELQTTTVYDATKKLLG